MSDIKIEQNGRILEVTLDRPKANAINAATSKAMGAAFQRLLDDDDLSVGIITGGGDHFFAEGIAALSEKRTPQWKGR